MNPRSRGGETNEFNLFPFKIVRHNSWHKIFLNMTMWEVWEQLDCIYEAIFNSDSGLINRNWLSVCKLSNENDLKMQMERTYVTRDIRSVWVQTFRSRELSKTRKFLRYMMLFIIFGSDMAYPKKLFNDDSLRAFFREFPLEGERKRAFKRCFGGDIDLSDNVGLNNIKLKISEILR